MVNEKKMKKIQCEQQSRIATLFPRVLSNKNTVMVEGDFFNFEFTYFFFYLKKNRNHFTASLPGQFVVNSTDVNYCEKRPKFSLRP